MTDQAKPNTLTATAPTPIAQLSPELPDQSSLVVEGDVTITWPFSVVTKSTAFKLVEKDFRLRYNKGQVRVEFHGPAGKAVADANIGGGDEIHLGLDGVEWEKATTPTRPDSLEWQLKFKRRLNLRVRRAESRDEHIIQIDSPDEDDNSTLELPPELPSDLEGLGLPTTPRLTTTGDSIPFPRMAFSAIPGKRFASSAFDSDEYTSPAFLKRARVSYGSLFEGGLDDLFNLNEDAPNPEEKKTARKKRPRFSMDTNWRYEDRTPEPESDSESEELSEECQKDSHQLETPSHSTMVDGGCQTLPVEMSPVTSAKVSTQTPFDTSFTPETPTPFYPPRPTHINDEPVNDFQQVSFTPPGLPLGFQGTTPGISDMNSRENPHESGSSFRSNAIDMNIDPSLAASEQSAMPIYTQEPRQEYGHEEQLSSGVFDPAIAMTGYAPVDAIHAEPPFISPSLPGEIHHALQPSVPSQAHHSAWPYVNSTSTYRPFTSEHNNQDNPVLLGSSSPIRERSPDIDDARARHEDQTLDSDDEQHTDQESVESEDDGDDIPIYEMSNYDDEDVESEVEENSVVEDDVQSYGQSGEDNMKPGEDVESGSDDEDSDESASENEGSVIESTAGDQKLQRVDDKLEDEELRAKVDEEEVYADNDVEQDSYVSEGNYDENIEEEGVEEDVEDEEDEAEQEYDYDDEEPEDIESEVEESEEEVPYNMAAMPASSMPKDPVFISLLSDSEDEEEDKVEDKVADKQHERVPLPVTLGDQPVSHISTKSDEDERKSPIPPSESEEDISADDYSDEDDEEQEDVGQKNENQEHEDDSESVDDDEDMQMEDAKPSLVASRPKAFSTTPSDNISDIESYNGDETDHKDERRRISTSQMDELMSEDEAVLPIVEQESPDEFVANSTQNEARDGTKDKDEASQAHSRVNTSEANSTNINVAGEASELMVEERDTMASNTIEVIEAEPMDVDEKEDVDDAAPSTAETARDAPRIKPLDDSESGPALAPTSQSAPEQLASTNDENLTSQSAQLLPNSPPQGHAPGAETSTTEQEASQEATDEFITQPEYVTRQPMTILSSPLSPTRDQQAISQIHSPSPSSPLQVKDTDTSSAVLNTPLNTSNQLQPLTPTEIQESKTSDDVNIKSIDTNLEVGQGQIEAREKELLPPTNTNDAKEDGVNLEEMHESQGEDEYSVEQQILEESQILHTPSQDQDIAEESKVRKETSPTRSEQSDAGKKKSARPKAERDILITVQSLRSWDHRISVSSQGTSDGGQLDPSVLLARGGTEEPAGSPRNNQEIHTPAAVRVARSRSDDGDPSLLLAKVPQTPLMERRKGGTPDSALQLLPGHRRLGTRTPDNASDILGSPSVSGTPLPGDEQVSSLKFKLTKELRERLPEFFPLKGVKYYLHRAIDVIGVATAQPAEPRRPKNGPRDYMMEVILTDTTTAPSAVVAVQVFRPHASSMPKIQAGDIVLFRRVQVVALRKRGFGLRTSDTSAWAVFEKDDEEMLPQIRGPPMELSDEELSYAEGLKRWWGLLGERAKAKIDKATDKTNQAGRES